MASSKMKCHYEVLNVERNSTDEEIKKSYRKLALRCHPDKNPDNIEECTKQFHILQQAYEVLTDPQERAWYDKHREAILKGGLGHGENYEDNCLDVYQYFNTWCYTGFGDDEEGFYAVYKTVFETIAAEDIEYKEEVDEKAPGFGNSQSVYEEVVGRFYAYWEGYCTAKSYVWVEKYDTREAPNRPTRRAMEQENKKLRDRAKKDRNEEVRALVAFVRKRDKRVQAYKKKLEARALEIEEKTKAKKKRQKQEKLKKYENYKEADWLKVDSLEKQLQALDMQHAASFGEEVIPEQDEMDECETELHGHSTEEDGLAQATNDPQEADEQMYDDLYCIACNKPFKTQKAFDNHENSKKHRQNVEALKLEMEEEEQDFAASAINGEIDSEDRNDETTDVNDEADALLHDTDEDDALLHDTEVMYEDLYCQFCDKFFTDESALYDHTLSKKHQDTLAALHPEASDEDEEDGRVIGEQEAEVSAISSLKTEVDDSSQAANRSSEKTKSTTQQKQHSNKQSKKSSSINSQKSSASTDNHEAVSLNCNVCKEEFPTRNKLFKHIKETGHALRVDGSSAQLSAKAGKQKKNKKNKAKS